MKLNRFWVCGLIVAVGLTAGIAATIKGTAMEYVEIAALKANPARYQGRRVKVTGKVVPKTTQVSTNDSGESVLQFEVRGETGAQMRVYHRGPKPDAFKDDGVVILEGQYQPRKNQLRADSLLAKCPSRYEEKAKAGEKAPHGTKPPTRP